MAVELNSSSIPRRQRILLVTSPKGGVGKTGLTRNLAVAAAQAGFRVAMIDLDKQRTLSKWWARRPAELIAVSHFGAEITDSEEILRDVTGFDLVIIDTPTSVEEYPDHIERVIDAADFVLIPSQASIDDTESVVEWMKYVRSRKRPAAFVLNRVRRNASSLREAKLTLNRAGRLCPVEVPQAEDVVRAGAIGASILEIKGAGAAQEFEAVWDFVRAEMGI